MRQPIQQRPSGRRRADYFVDSRGRALNAAQARRSPLWTFALVGLAGVALTSPELAVGEALLASGRAAAHGGEVLIASARAAVESAAELIRKRSPGIRTKAQLVKIKHARVAQARPGPTQRAKPRLRAPIETPPFLAPPDRVPLAFADQPYTPGILPVGGFPDFPITGGGAPCYCAFGFIPPVFGGGGGGGLVLFPPEGENPNPPVQPPGIPEPQSWALMILGFGAVGTAWRKRRSLVAAILSIPRLTYAPIR